MATAGRGMVGGSDTSLASTDHSNLLLKAKTTVSAPTKANAPFLPLRNGQIEEVDVLLKLSAVPRFY